MRKTKEYMTSPVLQPSTIPVPDPTKLTTDAVDRAKAELDIRLTSLRELFEEKFKGVSAAFKAAENAARQQNESSTLAIDKASAAFAKQIDSLDEKISDLKERMSELTVKNYSAIGGYIVGVLGAIAIVVTIIRFQI